MSLNNEKFKSEEKNEENKDLSETEKKSTNSQYINPKDNIDNLKELKNNLNGENKYFDKYIKALSKFELDNNDFEFCYENEENI